MVHGFLAKTAPFSKLYALLLYKADGLGGGVACTIFLLHHLVCSI